MYAVNGVKSYVLWALLVGNCLVETLSTSDVNSEDWRLHRKLIRGVHPEAVEGQYLVRFHDGVESLDAKLEEHLPGGLKRLFVRDRFEHVFQGFVASLTERLLKRLVEDDDVLSIEEDHMMQEAAIPWGLDRIDQIPSSPLDDAYNVNRDGTGVTVYVLDSGIYGEHSDFEGRIIPCAFNSIWLEHCDSHSFHGTHVAGTVGGTQFGVAKNVTIVGVKVHNQRGFAVMSKVTRGVDFVASQKRRSPDRPMVVNISLESVFPVLWRSSLNGAVNRLVDLGVVVVVAAGNSDIDACSQVPASAAQAITVGATDSTDSRASFSNYGPCIDVFAPGVGIRSAWNDGPNSSRAISGTSMASPHVAGAAALILQDQPELTPAEVLLILLDNAVSFDPGEANTTDKLLNLAFLAS